MRNSRSLSLAKQTLTPGTFNEIKFAEPGKSIFADERRRDEVVKQLAEQNGYKWIENSRILNGSDRRVASRHLQELERQALRQGKPKPTFPKPQKQKATSKAAKTPRAATSLSKPSDSTPKATKSRDFKSEALKRGKNSGCGSTLTRRKADGTVTRERFNPTKLDAGATRC